MIWSRSRKSHMLVSKLHSGTSKTKTGQGGLVQVALFWKSHCTTCSPACVILYHVTGSCKGPIFSVNPEGRSSGIEETRLISLN